MRYSFEVYVLDPYRRTLTRDGADVALGERAFSVLQLLVESAGELVLKQDLMDQVWGDVAVVEDNLVKAVGEVRHALGDRPAEAHFVRTVHRRGYRFVAPVQRLDEAAETTRAPAAVAPPPRRFPLRRWVLVAAAGILVGAGIGYALRPDAGAAQPPTGDTASPIAGWNLRPLDDVPAGLFKPAFSPVGDLLVAVMTEPDTGVHSLVLLDPGRAEPLQLTHGIEVRGPDPVFSADGRSVWFATYHHDPEEGLQPDVLEVPLVGGIPRLLIERSSTASPDPDGGRFVAAVVTAEGTVIEVVQAGQRRRIAERGYWPRWSPDGQWIAYTTSNPEGGEGRIFIVRPDGTDSRQLTSIATQTYGLCWSFDSSYVVFTSNLHGSGNLWIVGIDGRAPQPVTRGPGEFASPSFSHDGAKLVFAHAPVDESIRIAASPDAPATVIADESDFFSAALSPDGRFVALVTESPTRHSRLIVLEIASGRRREIGTLRCEYVQWTPDGRSLLVTALAPDESAFWIWMVPLEGGTPRPVTRGPDTWSSPVMSPDGRRLAAARETPDGHELVILDLESGSRRVLFTSPVIEGIRWSPGGDRLAWSGDKRPADAAASGGIWVIPAGGGEAVRLVADGAFPLWEPSGEGLLFARFVEHDGLWRLAAGGGIPARVRGPFEPEGYLLESLDVAREGTPLLTHGATDRSGLFVLERP